MTNLKDLLSDFADELEEKIEDVKRTSFDDDMEEDVQNVKDELIEDLLKIIVERLIGQ
jgi:hypothetical protein